MRLDKYLKVSRIIKRRTVANDACDAAHVTVNGRRASIPSMVLSQGDVVAVKDNAKSKDAATRSLEAATQAQMPAWIELDKAALKGTVISIPTREQIAPIVDEQAIVELYSR